MLDLARTAALIKGGMTDPDTTWDNYLPEAGNWQKTAILLTVPLIVASAVIAYLLDIIIPNQFAFIPEPTLVSMLIGIVIQAVAAAIVAFVVAFLAGAFKGTNSFPHALAATTLAFIPGYIGNALAPLPWIGWLLSLGLGIYGLVLLWRILPKYLNVPDTGRVGHYILSIIVSIIVFYVLIVVVAAGTVGRGMSDMQIPDMSSISQSGEVGSRPSSGAFSEMERQGRILEAAENDRYQPPDDGMLKRAQVETLISVMQKTRDYQQDQTQRLQELSEKADAGQASFGEAMSGLASAVGVGAAEMEVVKTGGGNWAEHMWVKEQLQIARIQRDINDAVKHNHALYQEYEQQLRDVGL